MEQPKQYTPEGIAVDIPVTRKDSMLRKIIPPVVLALALVLPVVYSSIFLSGVHDVNQVSNFYFAYIVIIVTALVSLVLYRVIFLNYSTGMVAYGAVLLGLVKDIISASYLVCLMWIAFFLCWTIVFNFKLYNLGSLGIFTYVGIVLSLLSPALIYWHDSIQKKVSWFFVITITLFVLATVFATGFLFLLSLAAGART